MNTGPGLWGTPDYFNTCAGSSSSVCPPATFAGTCSPHTGNAMTALVMYNTGYANYREYLATPLTCSMQPGITYTFSFWLSNGTGVKSPWTIANIGACFTPSALSQSSFAVISATPQCEITSNVVSNGWTQYTFAVTPTVACGWLTIGNFRTDGSNNATMSFSNPGGAPSAYANYFVDDVSLIAPSSTLSGISPTVLCTSQTFTLSANGFSTYSWTSSSGSLGNASVAVVTPTATTTYSLAGTNTLTCVNNAVFPFTVTPINLTVTATQPTACVGMSIGLNSTVNGFTTGITYSWTPGPATPSQTVANASGTYVYSLTVRNANCSDTKTTQVVFAPAFTIGTPGGTLCPGTNTILQVSGATNYTWLPINLNGSQVSVAPSSSPTYTILAELAGCTNSTSFSLPMYPTLTYSFNTYSITCASLGSATIYAINNLGPPSFTWLPSLQTNSAATQLTPGTHSVIVIDNGSGCVSTATTVFLPLVPLTATLVSTPSVLCSGDQTATASFTALAGGSPTQNFVWSDGSSLFTGNPVNTLSAGTWSAFVTDALTGCQVFSVFVVTQPPALSININPSTPTACVGGNILFLASPAGGVGNYTWNSPSGSNTLQVNEMSPGSYSYSITLHDANGCSTSSLANALYLPFPTLTVVPDSICPLMTGTVSVSGATSYSWNGMSGFNYFSDNPMTTTAYTVIGDLAGCTSSAAVSIVLRQIPSANIISNSPICQGANLQLLAGNATLYSWSGPNGFASAASQTVIQHATTFDSGLYSLTVTAANGCTASSTSSITVKPNPVISLASSSPYVRANATTDTIRITGNGTSFSWNPPQAVVPLSATAAIVHPATTTTYNVAALLNGCTSSASIQVTVRPLPIIGIALSQNSLCLQNLQQSPASVQATLTGAQMYTVVPQQNVSYIPVGNVVYASMSGAIPNNSFALIVIGSNGYCSASNSTALQVVDNPTIAISSLTGNVCPDEPYVFYATGASSFSWNIPANVSSTLSPGVLKISARQNIVGTVFGTTNRCNSALQQFSLNIKPLPVIWTDSLRMICPAGQLTLSVLGNATSYNWKPSSNLNSMTGGSVIAKPVSATQYTIVGYLNGCSDTVYSVVRFWPVPTVSASCLGNGHCLGSQVTLLANPPGNTYTWRGPLAQQYNGPTLVIDDTKSTDLGNYTVTATDRNGCQNTAVTTVTMLPLPNGTMNSDKVQVCVPDWFSFDFIPANDIHVQVSDVSYFIDGFQQPSGIHSFYCSLPATHTLQAKITDINGCTASYIGFINAVGKPVADFAFEPTSIYSGLDEVKFTASERLITMNKYWYFTDGSRSNGQTCKKIFEEDGEVPVALVVNDDNGCSDTIVKKVPVKQGFYLYVPNSFTPNDDRVNDLFYPVISNVNRYRLRIFDRWGKVVFESTNMHEQWNGKYEGKPCEEAVYEWTLEVTTPDMDARKLTGRVLLYR